MITEKMSSKCYDDYRAIILKLTGITISDKRETMLEGRFRKRLSQLGLTKWEQYLDLVKKDKAEHPTFIDLITTNETYFYRTPRIWEYIEQTFLPNWYQKNPGKKLKAWSAASSSGEEAHTLGLVFDHFKAQNSDFDYHVTGTDISQEIVEKAQRGHYNDRSFRKLSVVRKDLFESYITQKGDHYMVDEKVRKKLQFRCHNLMNPLAGSERFDLVLLRNVIIYFDLAEQKKVFANIQKCMFDHSNLIIGESESLNQFADQFEVVAPFVYQKTSGALKKAS